MLKKLVIMHMACRVKSISVSKVFGEVMQYILISKYATEQYFHHEYWHFMEQFPALSIEHIKKNDVVDELLGIILHGSIG